MGCSISKRDSGFPNDGDGVVSLCNDRKRLVKDAVGRRKAFAEAHCKYLNSLSSVSSAVSVFVASYSSASSSSPSPPPSAAMVAVASYAEELQNQNPYDRRDGDFVGVDSWSVSSGQSDSEGENGDNSEVVCQYFYGDSHHTVAQPPPPMPSPPRGFGWDFFSLLDDPPLPAVDAGYGERLLGENGGGCGGEDDKKLKLKKNKKKENDKKEKKGKADREEEGLKGNGEMKGTITTTTTVKEEEKDLMEALKSLEKEFARAYESGFDVSRMLEVSNRSHLLPVLEEIDENRNRFFQPLKFGGLLSPSSQSSSSKSLISSTSNSSSTWTDCKSDLFDGCGAMESGSHSFTLGRLYAWEKKLYEEVKAGEQARKCYLQKLSHIRKQQQVKGGGGSISSKASSELADLYNKILVVGKSAESISKQINKLRDEELQPQIEELLHGLMRTWTIMLECHETQSKIMNQVKSFTCSDYEKVGNESQRLATQQLEAELQAWLASFTEYLSTEKSYVNCLFGYLSKLVDPAANFHHFNGKKKKKKHSSIPPLLTNGPALLLACQDWSASLERLPENDVKFSMKCLAKDVHALWVQQGEEHDTKRKVQSLAKEVERRALIERAEETTPKAIAFGKPTAKLRLLSRMNIVWLRGEDLMARKSSAVDLIRDRLETEKESHRISVEKTRLTTLTGLKTGFCSVFVSLAEYSRVSMNLYADLVTLCEKSG